MSPPPTPSIPLFPLGTVLLPGGTLPLRIFEVRYLHMVEQCRAAGTPFGIATLSQGSEVRRPGAATEQFHPIGTLARITHCDAPQPGLLEIDCAGTQRFRTTAHHQRPDGLWMADIELLADDAPTPIPDDLRHTSTALAQLLQTLRAQHIAQHRFPILPPVQLDDCGWVANRWCEMLPLPLSMRYNLMALESPLVRLELVADLLATARPMPHRPT